VLLVDAPIVDARPLITAQRAAFVSLLRSLDADAWGLSTACPGWSVKDVVSHVLSDDLGWLARERDRDRSGLLDASVDHRAFIRSLNAKNQRWVDVMRELSPRLLCDLLAWVGGETDVHYAGLDLAGAGFVWWAGGAVPQWFDVAQDLTEHWLHEQQVREAVGRVDPDTPQLAAVLHTLVWALPHHYRSIEAPIGSTLAVEITGTGGGEWTLTRGVDDWQMDERVASASDARVVIAADAAWRLFAGALTSTGAVRAAGDPQLAAHFSSVRAFLL
jgi:uncharacterized protein (TIGR03083 family)